jgi:hypothetical protein
MPRVWQAAAPAPTAHHRVTERRLRNAELGGRAGEAALLRDGKEHEDVVEGFAWQTRAHRP